MEKIERISTAQIIIDLLKKRDLENGITDNNNYSDVTRTREKTSDLMENNTEK